LGGAGSSNPEEALDPGIPEQSGEAPEGGVWKDVTDPEGKPAKGPSALSRAEKILGGTTRFVKRKPTP
jgi:hypothetical protein